MCCHNSVNLYIANESRTKIDKMSTYNYTAARNAGESLVTQNKKEWPWCVRDFYTDTGALWTRSRKSCARYRAQSPPPYGNITTFIQSSDVWHDVNFNDASEPVTVRESSYECAAVIRESSHRTSFREWRKSVSDSCEKLHCVTTISSYISHDLKPENFAVVIFKFYTSKIEINIFSREIVTFATNM